METFLSMLGVAFIGWAAFVAYTNPLAFAQLAAPPLALAFVGCVAAIAWDAGVATALEEVAPYIQSELDIERVADTLIVFNAQAVGWLVVASCILLFVFYVALRRSGK